MAEIGQVVVHFGDDFDEFQAFKKFTEIMLGKKVDLLNDRGDYSGTPCWQEWSLDDITPQEFNEHIRKFNEFIDFLHNGK